MVSLSDPKMKNLADVFGNKTCKKIIDYLADNEEASQKDLSDALKIPMNTMEYNMKKLLDSKIVQKRSNFFWSKKGKKIVMYELSNKSIVISPRKSAFEKMKGLLPAFMLVAVGSFAAYVYEKVGIGRQLAVNSLQAGHDVAPAMAKGAEIMMDSASVGNSLVGAGGSNEIASAVVTQATSAFSVTPGMLWVWFLAGGLLAMFVVSLVNWRKL